MNEAQDVERPRVRGWVLLTGIELCAGILYFCTLAPGLMWGDSARFADRSIGYVPGAEPGEHHLRDWFGLLANQLPWGSVPWRQNLVSAFFGMLAVGALARLVLLITRSAWATAIAAAAFAVSHTQWHLSEFAESYTLLVFLWIVATELLLRWQATGDGRWVLVAAFVCGLAAADHVVTFVLGPAVVLFLCIGRPWPGSETVLRSLVWVPLLAVAFIAGYMPALAGGIRVHLEEGMGWKEVVRNLLDLRGTQYFAGSLGAAMRACVRLILLFGYQFPSPAVVLGIIGLISGLRRSPRRTILPLLLFLSLFAWTGVYLQQRNAYLMIVDYAMFALWVGEGAALLGGRRSAAVLALCSALPPALYAVTPALIRRFDISIGVGQKVRKMEGRDEVRYFLVPWKNGEDSAERYAHDALQAVPLGSVILHDFTPGAVISYAQRWEGMRRDVRLVSVEHAKGDGEDLGPWIERTLSVRDVFLASDAEVYRVDRLRAKFDVRPVGPLLQVRRK